MADVTGVVSGARQAIGPYFSLVSLVPSLLFVAYVYTLAASGAWRGEPHLTAALDGLRDLGLGGLALLVLASLGFGVVVHPTQFILVQVLEGYWGVDGLTQRLRSALILRHHNRLIALNRRRMDRAEREAATLLQPGVRERISLGDEADRLFNYYPDDPKRIMPTRLGNVLRHYEDAAGRPFGMQGLAVLPYVALVADDKHVEYLNDQRSGMDLAVRTALTSALACAVTVLFLWDDGLWLLLALVPYAATYLAYRGAVVTASHYGVAMCALIALNRFRLYERLRVPLPTSSAREEALNRNLQPLISSAGPPARLRFVHPKPPTQ